LSNDLFFIPIIERALRRPDVSAALREAFKSIETLGRQAPYRRGYDQFQRLMAEANDTHPELAAKRMLQQFEDAFERPAELQLILQGPQGVVARIPVQRDPSRLVAGGLRPGRYVLRLDTGRVLWEGQLRERDLLWTKAFGGKPLELAADTEEAARSRTKELALLDEQLMVRVYAGLESGRLEAQWQGMVS
jgi:hypothetical protein